MNDDVGFGGAVPPFIGGLLRAFRSRRSTAVADEEFQLRGSARDRIPNNAQLAGLIQNGLLVLPPRYFIGFFLDMVI